MLSICIPVYNFNVNRLLESLNEQTKQMDEMIEIVLIDDCSDKEYKELNREICQQHIYIELDENIGRSKIRNLFLKYTKYQNLLFLDCDSYIFTSDFLKKYEIEIKQNNFAVIFGGRVYENKKPPRTQMLSWKYGVYKESKNALERGKTPNKSFMTNNFVIKREILENIRFDERLTRYGHEDTLFGIALLQHEIEITHIENPVLNGDIETNAVYLKKTEEGINNLLFIEKGIDETSLFKTNVSLLDFYHRIKAKGYLLLIDTLYTVLKKPIRWLLLKGFVNLKLFDLYKLGYYSQLRKKEKS